MPAVKMADSIAQMVECLPTKYEDPSSNPSTGKKLLL
jgi:hypothetical protein